MSQQTDYYLNICRIMLLTRACRFNAASTLAVKDRWSVATVAVMSAYMLGWSLVTIAYPEHITQENSKFFGTVSALTSLALIVISLMDYSFDRPLRSQKLRKNALVITELMRAMERELSQANPDALEMSRIAAAYESENTTTEISHSSTEMYRVNLSRSSSKNILVLFLCRLRFGIFISLYYLVHLLVYIAVISLLISSTAWYTYHYVHFT